MRRREFIAVVGGAAVVAWPLAAGAQQAERVRHIDILMNVDDADLRSQHAAFLQFLKELGWTDGRNVQIDTRWTKGPADIRRYVTELAALAPDVIVITGTAAMSPMLEATRTGNAYKAKGDLDRAIADYDQAITLDPNNTFAYTNRGFAYYNKGQLDRAIADYDQVIALDPKYPHAYFNRGLANLYADSLAKALADLDRSSQLDPKYPYAALWRDIVDKRSNQPSQLPMALAQIDMTKWPAPLIRLYLGQLTPAGALAAADDSDANTKKGHVCEANFFIGELALQQENKEEATRLFRLAANDCPKSFYEWPAVSAELRALGVNPK